MGRIILDTNVLVSALLSPDGNAARILDLLLNDALQICYDARIIAEYEDVLLRPKFSFDKRDVTTLVSFFIATGDSITPAPCRIDLPDEGDRKFYELLQSSNARLVTGNLKHYPREERIVTPAQFMAIFAFPSA